MVAKGKKTQNKKSTNASTAQVSSITPHEESIDHSHHSNPQSDYGSEHSSENPLPYDNINDYAHIRDTLISERNKINELIQSQVSQKPTETQVFTNVFGNEAKDLLKKVKFNGSNFSTFKSKFKTICQLRKVWTILTGEETVETCKTEQEKFMFQQRSDLVKAYLETSLTNDIFDLIREDESPAEMWATLVSTYEKKEWSNTIYVMKKLCSFKYFPKVRMIQHINSIRKIIRELKDMGKEISEAETIEWILISLPDKGPDDFSSFISTLKPSPTTPLTLKYVVQALLMEEEKRVHKWNKQDNRKNEQHNKRKLYHAEKQRIEINQVSSSDSKWCYICRKKGDHLPQDHKDFDPNYNKSKKKKNVHFQKKRKEEESGKTNQNQSYTINCITSGNNPSEDQWILDNGAQNHCSGNKTLFINMSNKFASIETPNGTVLGAKIGTVKIKTRFLNVDSDIIIKNVCYNEQLQKNLLSQPVLLRNGYQVIKYDVDEVILENPESGHKMLFQNQNDLMVLITEKDSIEQEREIDEYNQLMIWHRRLNHPNMKTTAKIIKPLTNGSNAVTEQCPDCLQAKAKRMSYKHQHHYVALKPLENVHTDLCGPIRPQTRQGEKYTSMFIDENSRYIFGKLLSKKNDAIKHLNEILSRVENQVPKFKFTYLYSDGGGEYVNSKFKEACDSRGIQHNLTNPSCPEENHLAEKCNEYVFDKIRTLLISTQLPHNLWGYAFNYVIYVYNHTPQELLNGRTPHEVLFNRPSRLYMLKTWGCLAYKFVPKHERKSKLSNKANPCVFLGYSTNRLAYILYDIQNKIITTSRSVKFDELKIKNGSVFDNSEFQQGKFSAPDYRSIIGVDSGEELESIRFTGINNPNQPEEIEVEPNHHEIQDSKRRLTQNGEDADLANRQSFRKRRKPARYETNHVSVHTETIRYVEPKTFKEMIRSADQEFWMKATRDEYNSLLENETWELTYLPPGRKALGCKWVWKCKYKADGSLERFKARLVIKGFLQIAGVDFTDTFAPVVRLESLRVLCALTAMKGLICIQLDIKTAFLYSEVSEEIYMQQPEGFKVKGQEHLVCKLKKSIYGLKQAPRQWYQTLHEFLLKIGFTRCYKELCMYVHHGKESGSLTFLAVYVDDITIAGNNLKTIVDIKQLIMEKFKVSDVGEIDFLLGIKIRRHENGSISLNQSRYIRELLARFNCGDCHPAPTPLSSVPGEAESNHPVLDPKLPYRQLVGCLQYLVSATRPDLANAVRELSKHLHDYNQTHWKMAKRVLKYLKATPEVGIIYNKGESQPEAYSDADFANDKDSKSITGVIITMASAPVIWISRKQSLVGLSTTEVEYIAATEACKSIIWLSELLSEMIFNISKPITLHIDNKSTIKILENATSHNRTKHIRLRYHFIRDLVQEGKILPLYCNTKEQIADICTKILPKEQHKYLCDKMNITECSDQ